MGRRENEREAAEAARIARAMAALIETLTPLSYDERWRTLAAVAIALRLPRVIHDAADQGDPGPEYEPEET